MTRSNHQPRHAPATAAILVGGAATRMGGAVKALLEIDGSTILDRLLATLLPRFAEVLLVAKEPEPFLPLLQDNTPWRLVLDTLPGRSSLTGIHTALTNARTAHVFLTACDTPFLQSALLDIMLAWLLPEDDVVLPKKPDGYFEPLCALYSRRCLPHITTQLARNDHKIINFFDKVRVRPLPVSELLRTDPGMLSFKNANTPDELRALRETAADLRTSDKECP